MTAKEYLETRARMTEKCEIPCKDCPFVNEDNGMDSDCNILERDYPDEAIAIVQKWGEEHPVKSLIDKFFEIFPNAMKDKDGLPERFCPRQFGYKDDGCYLPNDKCVECWSQPYVEVEK